MASPTRRALADLFELDLVVTLIDAPPCHQCRPYWLGVMRICAAMLRALRGEAPIAPEVRRG